MQVCLGRTDEADPGFAAHYDGIRAGLAAWFRRILDAGARAHGIDPHTAALAVGRRHVRRDGAAGGAARPGSVQVSEGCRGLVADCVILLT